MQAQAATCYVLNGWQAREQNYTQNSATMCRSQEGINEKEKEKKEVKTTMEILYISM